MFLGRKEDKTWQKTETVAQQAVIVGKRPAPRDPLSGRLMGAAFTSDTDEAVNTFRAALAKFEFEGDVESDLGAREVASTDNSIYQVRPLAIVYPRSGEDVNRIVRAAIAGDGLPLSLSARGGNTGTNGQSLNRGVIVDFARHMTRILEIDVDASGGTVLVEPGVVLDQLNAALRAHGLFFPPMVSTAMSLADARVSLRAFVLPSLDTTINAMGNLLYNLATHPDQYDLLRSDPSLIPSAVYEGMRHTSILRWFSRIAAEDYRSGEVFIPKGERVMILFGAANRDPHKYPNPDRFDVTRNPVDQLSWSSGPHLCAGKHLARMEMECMLEAFVKNVARIEVDEPVRLRNRGVYGIKKLPMRLFRQ